MPDPHDLDAELHRHAGALRSLARDLLRDRHAAEDIAQDTLHAALAHQELRPGPMGGWLQRTLTNFAWQWRRGEGRRRTRESRLPSPDPAPAPPDTLGRRETLQAVTTAVLGLDEPYQTVVFLRYFEDLPPRAIAKRTATNLATVKSRLQRGLVMLRVRLDRTCGGDPQKWRGALLFTFGLPLPTVATASLTLTGAWLLGTTTKSLIAASLLCAAGLFVYTGSLEAPLIPAAKMTRTDISGVVAESGLAGAKTEEPVREAPPTAIDATLAWLDHPYLLELEVLVLDPVGLPVEGRTLQLAPPNCTLNDAPQATDANGKVVLSWRSRLPMGEVVFADERGTLRRIPLQHGAKTSITLGSRARNSQRTTAVRLIRGDRMSANGVPVLSELPMLGNLFTTDSQSRPDMQPGLHPHAVFGNAAAPAEAGPTAASAASAVTDSVSWSVRSRLDLGQQIAPKSLTRIAGTVFGEDGKAAAKTPVVLLGSGPQPVQRTETDEHGQFAFESLAAGEFTVRAGGDYQGLAATPVVTTTGTTPATLNLSRGSCIRGRAKDATGGPLAGAPVVFRAADGSWWDSTETQADGSFVLANLPGCAGTVLLWEPNSDRPLRVAVTTNVLANTPDLLLQFDAEAGSALQLDLNLPEGTPRMPCEVRVWQVDSDLGLSLPTPAEGKPWRLEHLVAGWYKVELFAAGAGWQDLGRHWLDGKADCDLGQVTLAPSAVVHLRLPKSPDESPEDSPPPPPTSIAPAVELYELRPDVDVRHQVGALDDLMTLRLPAGTYVLARRDATNLVHFDRFTVRSGESLEVTPKQ